MDKSSINKHKAPIASVFLWLNAGWSIVSSITIAYLSNNSIEWKNLFQYFSVYSVSSIVIMFLLGVFSLIKKSKYVFWGTVAHFILTSINLIRYFILRKGFSFGMVSPIVCFVAALFLMFTVGSQIVFSNPSIKQIGKKLIHIPTIVQVSNIIFVFIDFFQDKDNSEFIAYIGKSKLQAYSIFLFFSAIVGVLLALSFFYLVKRIIEAEELAEQ